MRGRRSVRHAAAAKGVDHAAAAQKMAPTILPVLDLSGGDRDVGDMTRRCGAVAWERISKRDGWLLLTRQDVFPGKGQQRDEVRRVPFR